ncbi:SDR family NAD(P)-dependent oxidoreductase [Pseudomonas aeruginosa]|nr:SDR family NAD(P)-dependent oxidoreductase [Pseudomonas aeruginosa]
MTTTKTIALFGAGSGLGTSLATRFGREGYRVALVARRPDALERLVVDLKQDGVEAHAFPADLTDLAGIPALIQSIEDRLGSVDVAVYAPAPSNARFVPAADLDAATLQSLASIFAFAPVEVSHAVLQGQLARGNGAIVIVSGVTAAIPMPGMSGVGPLMAAARNYALALNGEVAAKGVYVGTVSIGAMIERSTGLRALTSDGRELDPNLPLIDPDVIADAIWNAAKVRDQAEIILPRGPSLA